jgi:hypothetical protein
LITTAMLVDIAGDPTTVGLGERGPDRIASPQCTRIKNV